MFRLLKKEKQRFALEGRHAAVFRIPFDKSERRSDWRYISKLSPRPLTPFAVEVCDSEDRKIISITCLFVKRRNEIFLKKPQPVVVSLRLLPLQVVFVHSFHCLVHSPDRLQS